MFVGPERREQHQFAGLWCDFYVLKGKFGFAARTGHVIQVPDRNQLPLAEFVAAAVDVPVIELARVAALDGIAHVLEGALEVGVGLAQLQHGAAQ